MNNHLVLSDGKSAVNWQCLVTRSPLIRYVIVICKLEIKFCSRVVYGIQFEFGKGASKHLC